MIDYSSVFDDLCKRRDKLTAELEHLNLAINGMAYLAKGVSPASDKGQFAYMRIVDAAITALKSHGRPMRTREITDILLAGKVNVLSKKPENVVSSVLNREAKSKKRIVLIGRGIWALAGQESLDRSEAAFDALDARYHELERKYLDLVNKYSELTDKYTTEYAASKLQYNSPPTKEPT